MDNKDKNVEYMNNPEGVKVDANFEKNVANQKVTPGANAVEVESKSEANSDEKVSFSNNLVAGETLDMTVREKIQYEASEEVDDGDIYDTAIDVREIHKNDKNLVDGWTSENPAERDKRIEEEMEANGKLLDFEK